MAKDLSIEAAKAAEGTMDTAGKARAVPVETVRDAVTETIDGVKVVLKQPVANDLNRISSRGRRSPAAIAEWDSLVK